MTANSGTRRSLAAFARSISGAVARRTAYRRTLTELRRLSDRELADIGINRFEIDHVASRSVRA